MNLAKHYYEEFHRINPPRLGPYLDSTNLTKRQGRQLHALRKTYLGAIQQEINRCKKDITHGEIFVPSPWHAWILLTELHLKIIDTEDIRLNIPSNFVVPAYRGQSNASCPPIASLYRPNTDREYEQRCLDTFSFIFNQKFLWQTFGIPLPLDSVKATGQHYGIKTDLLDITADPAVAVYFASRSDNRRQGDKAAVFMFDLQHFLTSGIKIILPPPVVERLYLQRGAFLNFPETSIIQNSKEIIKISFPFNSSFQLLENGKKKNIVNFDAWFSHAVRWSIKWAKSKKSLPSEQTQIDNLLSQIFEEIGYPNIYQERNSPDLTLIRWIENFEEMMYWYAIRIQDNQEGILSGICHEIARVNPELIKFMILLYSEEIKMLTYANRSVIDINAKKNLQNIWIDALHSTSSTC